MDKVRKWSTRYDGQRNVLEFLERVEEQADAFQIDKNLLPRMMPELLKDNALLWYRNNNQGWGTWESFKEDLKAYFLPARYLERLEDEIKDRRQGHGESFKMYVIALQDMMRHAGYDREKQLARIFRNSRGEYQHYIRRQDFRDLKELIQLAEDFEMLKEQESAEQQLRQVGATTAAGPPRNTIRPRRSQGSRGDAGSLERIPNPQTACRRCGLQGHRYRGCANAAVLFCWRCGKRNVRTIECCQGNETGANSWRMGRVPEDVPPRQ